MMLYLYKYTINTNHVVFFHLRSLLDRGWINMMTNVNFDMVVFYIKVGAK